MRIVRISLAERKWKYIFLKCQGRYGSSRGPLSVKYDGHRVVCLCSSTGCKNMIISMRNRFLYIF